MMLFDLTGGIHKSVRAPFKYSALEGNTRRSEFCVDIFSQKIGWLTGK